MALPIEYEQALKSYETGAQGDLARAMAKLQARLNQQGLYGSPISARPQADLLSNYASTLAGKRGELELAGAERAYQSGQTDLARKFQEAILGKEQAFNASQNDLSRALQQRLAEAQLNENKRQFDIQRSYMLTPEQQMIMAGLQSLAEAGGMVLGTKLANKWG